MYNGLIGKEVKIMQDIKTADKKNLKLWGRWFVIKDEQDLKRVVYAIQSGREFKIKGEGND